MTAYAAFVRPNPDKMTLAQAKREPDWHAFHRAVLDEMRSLWANGIFEAMDRTDGAKVLFFQIICERRRGAKDEVARHKGRRVARGDYEVPGRDFDKVWAPVVCRATLLCLQSYVAAEGLCMHQLDVETAFLNGPIHEELYVRQPKGYERGEPGQVLRLRTAVFGLRQAVPQWNLELVKLLEWMGMTQSHTDPCLFLRDEGGERAFLLEYDCDIYIISHTQGSVDAVKQQVMAAFKSRDIGAPTYFLGLQLDRDLQRGHPLVSQIQYIIRLAERNGLRDSKPLLMPMSPRTVLVKSGEALPQAGIERYQALDRGASFTRPPRHPADRVLPVGGWLGTAAAPTVQHEGAALRILRYLRGTLDLGLRFCPGAPLVWYCDADYVGDLYTRRSTSGYAFLLNGAAVSWVSKLHPTVAVSTLEAEYIAPATAAREAMWLRLLLGETLGRTRPVSLWCEY
eukprot:TRINITY_DN7328_c0_g1_i1.p1 TRINITY_DN7328_c0_g1~~TRINITY_DN7328_c0_g1_i1.p1  ORF type:complete len:454 (+),score=45.14 TRINITY_DN7328_c0_g1_i1:4329-5690(+)